MANEKPTKAISKKHLARVERERRQAKLITIFSIAIIAAVIGLIGYGILNETVLVNRRPILTVNGEEITVREFKVRVKAQRQQMIDMYMQYYQLYMMFGMDPTQDQSLNSLAAQIEDTTQLGTDVFTAMLENALIRQYAEANGIVVTDEEIDEAIRVAFEYYPDGTPVPTPTSTLPAYSTLSPEQLALMTPTYTLDPNPAPTATSLPTATTDPAATATEIPSPTPTSTPYTAEGFQTRYDEALAYYGTLGVTDSDYRRFYFLDALYRERVMDAVLVNVPHEAEQVWARHILVADEATAQSIYARLVGGADFFAIAAENSIDTGNASAGGDLGWFGRGSMITEFEDAAFSLGIGEISQPVQTTSGWHIIQVLGHEVRPLSETDYTEARDTAFSIWLQEQKSVAVIVIADNWQTYVPDSPTLQEAFDNIAATQTASAENAPLTTEVPTP